MSVLDRSNSQMVFAIDKKLADINAKQARVLSEIVYAQHLNTTPDENLFTILGQLISDSEVLREKRQKLIQVVGNNGNDTITPSPVPLAPGAGAGRGPAK